MSAMYHVYVQKGVPSVDLRVHHDNLKHCIIHVPSVYIIIILFF